VRFAFERLPGATVDIARPALEVTMIGPTHTLTSLALIDTGSLQNRFAVWIADLAGIDLSNAESERIGVGGRVITARTVPTTLQLEGFQWDASVSFCDPWPFDFHLLGQLGFLRWFRVLLDAADETMEVTPIVR
jgi:hypothetical protein